MVIKRCSLEAYWEAEAAKKGVSQEGEVVGQRLEMGGFQ